MSQAFSRSIAMFKLIAAAMAMPTGLREQQMQQIGSYESRGKGLGLTTYARSGTNAQAQRKAKKISNVKRNRAAHR